MCCKKVIGASLWVRPSKGNIRYTKSVAWETQPGIKKVPFMDEGAALTDNANCLRLFPSLYRTVIPFRQDGSSVNV